LVLPLSFTLTIGSVAQAAVIDDNNIAYQSMNGLVRDALPISIARYIRHVYAPTSEAVSPAGAARFVYAHEWGSAAAATELDQWLNKPTYSESDEIVYAFSASTDKVVHGYNNPNTSSWTPTTFKTHVLAIYQKLRAKFPAKRLVFEMWNEGDHAGFFPLELGTGTQEQKERNAAIHLYALAVNGASALKNSGDTNISILTPSVVNFAAAEGAARKNMATYFYQYMHGFHPYYGSWDWFDGVAFHGYSVTADSTGLEWPARIQAQVNSRTGVISDFRNLLVANNAPARLLANMQDTEWNLRKAPGNLTDQNDRGVTFPATAMVATIMHGMNRGVTRQNVYQFVRNLNERKTYPHEFAQMPLGQDTATQNRAIMNLRALSTGADLQGCATSSIAIDCTFSTNRQRFFKVGNVTHHATVGTYRVVADLVNGRVNALPKTSRIVQTSSGATKTTVALVGMSYVYPNVDEPSSVQVQAGYNKVAAE